MIDDKFGNKVDQLSNMYGINKTAVQKSKENVLYKFKEIIARLIDRIFGTDSVSKAETLLDRRTVALAARDADYPLEAAFLTKISTIKAKYPDLSEMLDKEHFEINNSLQELQGLFQEERKQLENAKSTDKRELHRTNIERMAEKFLEFEEGLKSINLATDQILLPGLQKQLEAKFDEINQKSGFLSNQLLFDIQIADNVKDLNDALLILNQVGDYSIKLEEHFTKQNQKLEELNVPQSVRETIEKKQAAQWVEMVRSIKQTSQVSELKDEYENLLVVWNDDGLLGAASSYVAKEYQAKVSKVVGEIENDALKQNVREAADSLLQEAEAETSDVSKISYLNSLNDVVVESTQNFLRQEADALQPLLDEYGQKLSREEGLTPENAQVWTNEIKERLNEDILNLTDISKVNNFLKEINSLKEEKTFDHLLSPTRQESLHNRRKELELSRTLQALKAKFPKQRMNSMVEFLGKHAEGSLLAKVNSALAIASNPHAAQEEKEKAIHQINAIEEKQLIAELKVTIRKKAQELTLVKEDDIQKLKTDNERYLENYPWVANKDEARPIIEKCKTLIHSAVAPEIKDLDKQSTLKELFAYTEKALITEKIVQKNYKAKQTEAFTAYANWLEEQIGAKLDVALLPVYRELTKGADPNKEKENFQVYQDFVRDKANEMKTLIMDPKYPNVQEKLVDLTQFANSLKDELNGRLESFNPVDYVWKTAKGWFFS